MSDQRFYFLDEELQWLLAVRPDDEGGYSFLIARDGWMLLEARFEAAGVPYEEFIQHFLADLRTEAFHRRFHEVAKTYAPEMPTYQDCPGDCPWTCKREALWDRCFEDWAWCIPAELRAVGCRMFIHDDKLMKAETAAA